MDRLFVYGTLQPGAPNEHVLAGMGSWQRAEVAGVLAEAGWGAEQGYPGLVSVGAGPTVSGQVLAADQLDWPALDAFEGTDYVRRTAEVTLDDGTIVAAEVYLLSDQSQTDEAPEADGEAR